MSLLGAVVLGNTEAAVVAIVGGLLFGLLGWSLARWQAGRD
jgi:hypothetical protein